MEKCSRNTLIIVIIISFIMLRCDTHGDIIMIIIHGQTWHIGQGAGFSVFQTRNYKSNERKKTRENVERKKGTMNERKTEERERERERERDGKQKDGKKENEKEERKRDRTKERQDERKKEGRKERKKERKIESKKTKNKTKTKTPKTSTRTQPIIHVSSSSNYITRSSS